MSGVPAVVALVDFDGTAAAQNVAETLLERYGGDSWRRYRAAFRDGAMTLREYQERAFNDVTASVAEMAASLEALAWPRAGFAEFVDYCTTNAIHVEIATNGLDFYVTSVLERAGLGGVSTRAVEVEGGPGRLRYRYPYATADCWEWGNCKCRLVDEARAAGSRTVFVGDGASDYCAGTRADAAFARATMLERCRAEGAPHTPFEDFHDVLAAFRAGVPGVWPPPPPSTT